MLIFELCRTCDHGTLVLLQHHCALPSNVQDGPPSKQHCQYTLTTINHVYLPRKNARSSPGTELQRLVRPQSSRTTDARDRLLHVCHCYPAPVRDRADEPTFQHELRLYRDKILSLDVDTGLLHMHGILLACGLHNSVSAAKVVVQQFDERPLWTVSPPQNRKQGTGHCVRFLMHHQLLLISSL